MPRSETHTIVQRTGRPVALAVVHARALEMLRGGIDDFAQLAEIDGVLTGAVMRLARCPLHGAPVGTATLAGTVRRFGAEILADTVRAVAPPSAERDRAAVEAECRRWVHAVAVAAAARWLSNQGEYEAPEEAYLAGLVHVFATPDHPAVAASLADEWRLGPRIAAVMTSVHRDAPDADPAPGATDDAGSADDATRRLVAVVRLGDLLATTLGYGDRPGHDELPGADASTAAAVEEAISLELAHAAALLRLPTTPASELVRRLAAEEMRRREAPTTGSHAEAALGAVERLADVQRSLLELRSTDAIADILDRGLRAIHRGLGFDRVMLLETEPERAGVLRTRTVLCRTRSDAAMGTTPVEVPAPVGSALERAVEVHGVFRSDPGDPDAGALAALASDAFLATPLRAGGAHMGIVLADHFVRRAEPDGSDAASLAVATGTLGLVLEAAALQSEGRTLRSLAEKDELTGINNRRNIVEILRREVDRARRYGKPLALALVDVDHFKSWNDVHGHAVGDMVLQSVAQIITSASREIDTYGRYGGEEFLIVLPETSAEHAVVYAERLRTMIESHGAELSQIYPVSSLSVSIGVTQLLARGDDTDQMIHRADAALYAAKNHGRNRVCAEFTPQPKVVALPRSRGVLEEL